MRRRGTDDGCEDFAKHIRLTQGLQIVMNRAFRRKGSQPMFPLNARVQIENDRFNRLPRIRFRATKLALERSL
jgi:hypothetical protein